MHQNKTLSAKGFTLIELLVVIAVIGLLASVIMVSLNSARGKARDAQRASTVQQIQTALEMYYDDNLSYPSSGDVPFPGILSTALVPTYISSISNDPSNPSNYHYYTASQSPAQFYAIFVPYENKSMCYVCGGNACADGNGWWGVNMCH